MALFSRIANVFRDRRVTQEIDEELASHLAEAVAQGRKAAEARRAFGSPLRQRESSRDAHTFAWLDSLRADAIFGCRQLLKRKAATVTAILSLALAIGSCTSAFRLIDAMLLNPLPVAHADRLYYLDRAGMGFQGVYTTFDGWAYPAFQTLRAAVKDQAELIAVSPVESQEITYRSDADFEKASAEYVSAWMFDRFGLRPTLGRLLAEADDATPGAAPYAVISHDYWVRRFGGRSDVIGRRFRLDKRDWEIVGVAPRSFTGTETGSNPDLFLPAMMNPAAVRNDQTWIRTLAIVNPGVPLEPLRTKLDATCRAWETERAKGFGGMAKTVINHVVDQRVQLEPAAAGISDMKESYGRSLVALGIVVLLVLLIACVNVANLMAIQATARLREMALRVSIGAGRGRLVQLVLVESAILATLAAAAGALLAWWSAPFVVAHLNPPDNPARLALPAGWRVLLFGLGLTFLVTMLFGLAPALRAAAVKPALVLKGGEPHARRRFMHTLVAAQVAFCFLVLFTAGLFTATFDRLARRDMGFSADRLLSVDTTPSQPQPPVVWEQIVDRLRAVPGVEKASIASWALLSANSTNSYISIDNAPPGDILVYFLRVSPGWLDTVKLPLLAGRDFRDGDTTPGEAIVNETFVKTFYNGRNPIGRTFKGGTASFVIVGITRDAPYRSLREPIFPVAYTPFPVTVNTGGLRAEREAAFMIRTASADPAAMESAVRREIKNVRSDFRVHEITTEQSLIDRHSLRERLFAMLSLFFAGVALLLAAVGLYGVLDYSVLQRRREIGIRVAIGAQAGDIARRITSEVFAMTCAGALAGIALGLFSARSLETLLYNVSASSASMLALPAVTIFVTAAVAALPAVVRALRIDPAQMLRAE